MIQKILTKQQISVLCGGLLGDLNLNFMGVNWRLRSGTQTDKEWLLKQYEYIANVCKTPPQQDNKGRWWFNTVSIPDLQEIGPLWYPNATKEHIGKKIMPYNFIEENFDELSLATLFMGDGSKKDSGYLFCLDNFTFNEVEQFSLFLRNKYELNSNIQKKDEKPRLYIPSNSRESFTNLVLPYIVESQKRKLFINP